MRHILKRLGVKAMVALGVSLGAWTSGEAQRLTWLGTLGGNESEARGVLADGSVVVGEAEIASGDWRAFRWTAQGGMQDLGTLGGGSSGASGVSADGSVVVGRAGIAGGRSRAFRWTASGGMQNLGTLGGGYSSAFGVSADGSVVVGGAQNASGQWRAFRWTASGGMEDLNTTYASLLTNGSELRAAFAISPDGAILSVRATTPRQGATRRSCWILKPRKFRAM